MIQNLKSEFALLYAMLLGFVSENAELQDGSGLVTRARNAGTVIATVVIGVISLVGLLIFGEVYEAMPMNDGVFAENGTLNGTAESIIGGFGDAMGLVPIILIVLLASVVIGVVQRMRMG
jgi:hypothetical protein